MDLSRFKALVLSCVATVAFVGCGGGSDSTATATTPPVAVQTGTFVDAPVQGLKYVTLTQTGYTDENGTYKYVNGEQIEFFMGTLSLGKITASTLVTPYTMAGDTNISAPSDKAKNIAMLLQNFDANRSDSTLLDLRQLKDHNFSDVNLSVASPVMETKITALLSTLNSAHLVDGATHTLINAITASTAMANYVTSNALKNDKKFTQAYLSGKTFYVVSHWDPEGWVPFTITYNSNRTLSYYDAPDANETMDYTIVPDGSIKVSSRSSNPDHTTTLKTVTADYIETTSTDQPSTSEYFFLDKAKADAKLAQLQYQELATTKKFTQAYLSGKTFYVVSNWGSDGWVTLTNSFHNNGTFAYYDAPDANATVDYAVTADGRLKIMSRDPLDPITYATIKSVTDQYIEVNEYMESTNTYKSTNTYLCFDKTKAVAKLAHLQ